MRPAITETPAGEFLLIDLNDRGYYNLVGGHVHRCPECYEAIPCAMTCTVHPDLEEDDGTPCGSHVVCSACKKRVTDRERILAVIAFMYHHATQESPEGRRQIERVRERLRSEVDLADPPAALLELAETLLPPGSAPPEGDPW